MIETGRDLARRSRPGTVGYVLLFGVAVTCTDLATRPVMAAGFGIALAALIVCRVIGARGDLSRRRIFEVGVLGVAALWGVLASTEIVLDGVTASSLLFFLFVAGFASAATFALAPDRRLQMGALLFLLAPPAITAAARADSRLAAGLLFMILFFLGYLMVLGRNAHEEYMNGRENARRLQAAIEEAEAANASKSAFLANMSHEIRTPMTAIQGFADLLLEPTVGPTRRLEYVQIIRKNSDHLLHVINDILDISKIEAGGMTVERLACSPAQILLDVESLMRVKAAESGTALSLELDGPVPAGITSDPTRLRQILLNLVGNAIKFSRGGSVRVRAGLERRQDGAEGTEALVFRVIDDGIGISPEHLARLFQPFAQADNSTTRRYGGTGLGLVICRRLAVMLGGDVTLASALGEGTTATFWLPVEAGLPLSRSLVEADDGTAGHGRASAEPAPPSGRVLLAEDGIDNQRLISTHLRRAGCRVEIVDNGQLAVEAVLFAAAAEVPFDVVIMDMQMPVLDGYAAASRLREGGWRGPIVALTAHAMAGDRERCLAAGCDEYLTKPIQRGQLLETVGRLVAQRPRPGEREAIGRGGA